MDQKQENDSKTDKPFVHDAAGCSLAAVFVVAVVWLVLLLICILGYFLGDEPVGHNPHMLSICAAAVTVFCAAVGVPLLVIWGICLRRMQKEGQNRKNSPSDTSDPQLCPHLESQEQNSGASQTDKSTPLPCVPQESGGQNKEVSIADSSILDFTAIGSSGCLFVIGIIWIVAVSIRVLHYILYENKSGWMPSQGLNSDVTFLTFLAAIVMTPLWILWRISVYLNQRSEQNEKNPKADSTFLDLTSIVCSGCLLGLSVVALVLGLTMALDCFFYGSLFEWAIVQPFLGPFFVIPLLVLLRLFYHRNKRRGHDENHAKSASLKNFIFGFALAVGLFFLIALAFFIINCPD